ncbi:DsbA family oxidoreductase [Cellulomonas alba]|uniref:DsbA family oxidoreductase n=1 Tax=Cellulomonas alba TaxID=3053467 RepID=A0ABT7SL20_9CELL|nr:DsbA family oxidoreductase [Cellulomonas alba]MDM7856247.1 DsbA family oxidoreductase [Cellulomonas alba]
MTLPLHTLAPAQTLVVEVWSDIACPWCYIGKRRFSAALEAFEHRDHVEVVWRSYELSPDTPRGPGRPEAEALAEHKGIPLDAVQRMFAHVTAQAATAGLTYDFDRVLSVNSFDLHRLVHLAADAGGRDLADRTLESLFSAHFERGLDLGDPEAVVAVARDAGFGAAGLDDDAVRELLAGDAFADAVRADEAEAAAIGVTGVPFFVAGRRVAVAGAQPTEVFAQLLEVAWREANPIVTLPGATDAEACADDACAI